MKFIKLGGLDGSFKAIIDDKDFKVLNQWNWTVAKCGNNHYAVRHVRHSQIKMHKLLKKSQPGQVVDHRNNNGLDNQRHNLRICSIRNNVCNTSRQRGNTSRFKGVTWSKQKHCWAVQLSRKGKHLQIGLFKNEVAAAMAWDLWCLDDRGEFARPNFTPLLFGP